MGTASSAADVKLVPMITKMAANIASILRIVSTSVADANRSSRADAKTALRITG
jgi:BMFP domain-containing protein YqiC